MSETATKEAAAAFRAPPLEVPDLCTRPREELERMLAAGEEIHECYRVLKKGGLNIVGEMLEGQGTFYQLDHYPKGDVYDGETHAQYYYHAHRGIAGEHGHFHTFLRAKGMPGGVQPVPYEGDGEHPLGDDALTHFVAVSMDVYGFPIGLFATNRWVTGETWYAAGDVIRMLDRFRIDHAYPSWPSNRWITAMFRLFRPEVEALLRQRDAVVAGWAGSRPDVDVYEDRELEVTGSVRISVNKQIARVREALGA